MRLYLDANVIIYGVEGTQALRTVVLDWVDRVEAQDDGFLLTSELSLLECLVKPTRDNVRRNPCSSPETVVDPQIAEPAATARLDDVTRTLVICVPGVEEREEEAGGL